MTPLNRSEASRARSFSAWRAIGRKTSISSMVFRVSVHLLDNECHPSVNGRGLMP